MRTSVYLSFALFASLHTAAVVAQTGPPPPLPNICNGGLQPDGYIDWSGLRPASTVNYGTPSAPVTATLPVTGVPGLTVTVTIPPLTWPLPGSVSAYTVVGDSLKLNALDANGLTTIMLNFNKPVRGLGFVASGIGEMGYTATVNGSLVKSGDNSFSSSTAGSTVKVRSRFC
jgi:hypothetical protein